MRLEEIIAKVQENEHAGRSTLIGIEGFGGAGKSTLANKLKAALGNAYVIQTDDFIIKENLTLASPDMECYDLKRLERQVLFPATNGKSIVFQKLDWATNKLSEPINVPPVDYLIVEGITAYHPDIVKYYDYKIWVDTPIDVASQRGRKKDAGTENEQHWDLWSKNDLSYKEKYHPEKVADFVFNSN